LGRTYPDTCSTVDATFIDDAVSLLRLGPDNGVRRTFSRAGIAQDAIVGDRVEQARPPGKRTLKVPEMSLFPHVPKVKGRRVKPLKFQEKMTKID